APPPASCPIPGSHHLPLPDGYSSTPGGTVYPLLLAGTRIIYDRKFLLECKNSPVARTPPCCLPQIPGVTSLAQSSLVKLEELKERNESEEAMPGEQPRYAAPA
ncbi:4EBP3 protein, partial [Herpetotheres cachinnans]|nr:4EBP3 protein [Herpetotheres cachinnans]